MSMNLAQRTQLFPLLTHEHGLEEESITSVRVPAQVGVEVELQFLRILRAGQVMKQGNNPFGHRPLGQNLVHHILAPLILQEVRSDEQSPYVAVLHSLA